VTLPSKPQQIAAVAKFLDSDRTEGRSLEEIAKEVVEGYHSALMKGFKTSAVPLRQGMLIKTPLSGKVHRVQWLEGEQVWLVSETSSNGWLGPVDASLWEACEEYHPTTFKVIDGKRKSVPKTEEEIAEEWSNEDYKVGERLSFGQRQKLFEVVATAPKCVLMVDQSGKLWADDNSNLDRFYRRESGVEEIEW
jgi:hypothetical protein